MPIYDKRILSNKARELGFIRDTYEKMTRLIEILRFLNEHEELCSYLALKGGTAINLTIFNLPRLSVDIDLDFTKNLPKEQLMDARLQITSVLPKKPLKKARGYFFGVLLILEENKQK
jgi:predicted nucleotidyltransferase component of viral defense system